jgi:predicted nucleotidyltransferase
VRHYQGFANGRRKRLREPEPTVKHLLYAYRVYLSGINLMRTGNIVANLTVLNESFRLPEVDELVQRKREGPRRCDSPKPRLPFTSSISTASKPSSTRLTTRASCPTNLRPLPH